MTGTKAALTFPISSSYSDPPIFLLVAKINSGLSLKKKNPILKSSQKAIQECSEGAQRGMTACSASAAQEAKNNHILQTSVTALQRQHTGLQTIQATLTFTIKERFDTTYCTLHTDPCRLKEQWQKKIGRALYLHG